MRDPSIVGSILHPFTKGKKNISDRIVELPLGSIVDVSPLGGREHLRTFRSEQANLVSRPFRIVTTKDDCDGDAVGPAADRRLGMNASAVEKHHRVLLVAFEDVCRLRHFLVLACQSWAVRTGFTLGAPVKELVPCACAAAQRYLVAVLEVMKGPLRNQVDAQVEVMEDLADEMILDAAVKEAFFSSGDIFFEIARRLEATVTFGTRSATSVGDTALGQDGADGSTCGARRDSRDMVVADARLISAAAAVLDAAFFHSIQFPQRIDLVQRPKPMSLPAVAENLVLVYSALRSRISTYCNGADGDGEIVTEGRHGLGGASSPGSEPSVTKGKAESAEAMLSWDRMSASVLDRVVRALNGISEAVSLFNIENEHLGLVRNLVGIGLGIKVRIGIQPGASEALAFLVGVNDRAVGLIEDLDRWEYKQRQVEAARLVLNNTEDRKRGVLPVPSLSPSPHSRTSLTPPLSPESPVSKWLAKRSPDNDRRTSPGVPKRGAKRGGGLDGLKGLRGGRRGWSSPPASSPEPTQSRDYPLCLPRGFLWSAPVLLHSYAKLLNALVCGSYNLREAFFASCEVDIRNLWREGGYLDTLSGLDGGAPRLIFRQTAMFLHEVASLFFSPHTGLRK